MFRSVNLSDTKAAGTGKAVQAVEGEWEAREVPGQEEEEERSEGQKTAAVQETLTTTNILTN